MDEYNKALERAREIYSDPKEALSKNVNLTNEGSIAAIRVALLDLFPEEQLKSEEDTDMFEKLMSLVGEACIAKIIDKDTHDELKIWIRRIYQILYRHAQEWSEEDEKMLNNTLDSLKRYQLSMPNFQVELQMRWLKSLRPQPKQEWTDNDEQHLKWLCRIIHSRKNHGELSLTEESELGNWIDKWINHNPQPRWKPSEEQMDALRVTLDYMPDTFKPRCTLMTLQNDLKKLLRC